jgi:hypothetical protein
MKLLVLIVKFFPVLITILLIFQCILSLLDVGIGRYVGAVYGNSLMYNLLLLILSYAFRFCFWHRVLIFDLLLINCIVWVDINVYQFASVKYVWMLIVLLLTSSLISAYFYKKNGCFIHYNIKAI